MKMRRNRSLAERLSRWGFGSDVNREQEGRTTELGSLGATIIHVTSTSVIALVVELTSLVTSSVLLVVVIVFLGLYVVEA